MIDSFLHADNWGWLACVCSVFSCLKARLWSILKKMNLDFSHTKRREIKNKEKKHAFTSGTSGHKQIACLQLKSNN